MKPIVFFLLTFSTSLIGQNPNKYRLNIGGHYLATTDYSIQKPDGENSFKSLILGGSPSFEVQINFPFSKLFQFETGYRYKEHYIVYGITGFSSANWIETTHSIPLRIGAVSTLGRSRLLRRFSFGLGGGVLLDIMQRSDGVPLIYGGQFQIRTSSGTYLLKSDYDPNEVNQVKAAVSFNGQWQFSCKILKFMHIYIGYGYTHGTRTLAKGYYTIQTPTTTTKGSMATKGSYKYGMAGLRFTFSNKFVDSLPKL